jgi:hypothetical protein
MPSEEPSPTSDWSLFVGAGPPLTHKNRSGVSLKEGFEKRGKQGTVKTTQTPAKKTSGNQKKQLAANRKPWIVTPVHQKPLSRSKSTKTKNRMMFRFNL